ncbi:RDD family protein [Haloferula sargassicola]|uniref:RDD domain-containing protein n=1 Tax=Haloferula sargassicola TaxID=490096 RepID=A0ABP9UMS6_9BACT
MTGEVERRLDTLQAMELAEGVEIRLRIAGPLPRGGALMLDLMFQLVLLVALSFIVGLLGILSGSLAMRGLNLIAWFVITWWYPVLFEAGKRGATPGKRICGLRVVQRSGSPITIGQAILRNFLRYADGMPYMIGGIMGVPTYGFALVSMMATQRFQRLGDLAAGTVVVYDRAEPMPSAVPPPVQETKAPAVALSPEEVRAVASFRDRLSTWSTGRQIEIADHARELSGTTGPAGVSRLLAMAKWLQERD